MSDRQMHEIVRNQRPTALPPSATIQEACRCMLEQRIGAVLVTDPDNRSPGGLLGIFTGRDAVRVLAQNPSPGAMTIGEAMTSDPATMTAGCTAIEALRLMHDGGFRHLPVVRDGIVIGVVSRGDFRGLELDRLDVETGIWERMR